MSISARVTPENLFLSSDISGELPLLSPFGLADYTTLRAGDPHNFFTFDLFHRQSTLRQDYESNLHQNGFKIQYGLVLSHRLYRSRCLRIIPV